LHVDLQAFFFCFILSFITGVYGALPLILPMKVTLLRWTKGYFHGHLLQFSALLCWVDQHTSFWNCPYHNLLPITTSLHSLAGSGVDSHFLFIYFF
ncbi:unnamed protein product, partial [Prunus brigantina]